jgi:hypothetical protein
MAVTYAVIAGSEAEVRTALQQLCDVLGLEWSTRPQQLPGQTKWLGRLTTPEPRAETLRLPATGA